LRRIIKMKLKKILAALLATTMVFGSVMTVCAATGYGIGSGETEYEQVVQTYADQMSEEANAVISVGGSPVVTSIGGVYAALSVQGTAITTDLNTVKSNLGLAYNQKPVIIIYDTDATKSTKAMDSINAAVEAMGGTFVTALDVNLGARTNGKWVELSDGSVAMKAGLPKKADTSKTYSVVCVQTGGVVTILEDKDTDPNTVTFDIQAGLGTYAIVAE
jgi:hypothetical protein